MVITTTIVIIKISGIVVAWVSKDRLPKGKK